MIICRPSFWPNQKKEDFIDSKDGMRLYKHATDLYVLLNVLYRTNRSTVWLITKEISKKHQVRVR